MAKTTTPNEAQRPLATLWTPPPTVPGTEGGPGRPTVCVATTFTFSAELLECELLPRFLGLEFDPAEREAAFVVEREDALEGVTAAVLVDQGTVDARQTTLRWDQVPVRVPRGVQHAKVTLLAWERLVRLVVGSANLTVPGYRHNREVAGVLDFFDHADSTPRDVLDDALVFLDRVLGFAVAEPEVLRRVRAGLSAVTSRVRRWAVVPRAFAPREYPKVYFVPTLPHANGRVARSTLTQVLNLWGTKTARDVRLVTPFVGDSSGSFRSATSALARVPHARAARVRLGVPGLLSDADPRTRIAGVPASFRDAWASAWGHDARQLEVCVVVPGAEHRGRPVARPLHAKGLYLGNGDVGLLCCGSSNFSPSGMGIGVANVEANLCYLERLEPLSDGPSLHDRLPVNWERDVARRVVWPEDAPPLPEEVAASDRRVPEAFRWATLDPAEHRLEVGLADGVPLPQEWTVSLPFPESPTLASHVSRPPEVSPRRLTLPLPPEWHGVPITTLRIRWRDDDGEGEALMPVHVRDRAKLPPPASLAGLTAEGILACLLSGCAPAEWIEREEARRTGGGGPTGAGPAIDPHRVHDPSGLALYRVRRLGRGLAAIGHRLIGTVRTPEAVEYQVHRHPLGPMRLADALARAILSTGPSDGNGEKNTNGVRTADADPSSTERCRIAFSLMEVALMLAHAGHRLHKLRGAGEGDHRPCFRRAVTQVLSQSERVLICPGMSAADGSTAAIADGFRRAADSLSRYGAAVRAEAGELLDGLAEQEGKPCP